MAHASAESHDGLRKGRLDGFIAIYLVMFVVFMAVAMLSMLLAQNWRTLLPGAEGAHSLLGGVKSAVYTVISQLS
jgi:uncharacterized membrane protein YedE/YeeE